MNRQFYPLSVPSITDLEVEMVSAAVRSTWVSSLGEYIDRFENEFARFCGTNHAISVSNGTVALFLSLKVLDVGPGDEVIVPDISFIATANAVLQTGAMPVFCDVDPFNGCISPTSIESLITPKTKAVIPVHLYGHPADMHAIMRIAENYGIHVIVLNIEAHGSAISGQRVGSFGTISTFSFYGNKNLTTGEGGMITTNSDHLNERCRFLRDHAMRMDKRYWHTELGYNFRMTNMQAALGCAQLSRIDELTKKRRVIFEQYSKNLADLKHIRINPTYDWAENTFWLITVFVENMDFIQRESLMSGLKKRGIDSRPLFYPMSMMPYMQSKHKPEEAYRFYQSGLNLPTFIDLTNEDIAYICDQFRIELQNI